jgi:Zn-dependent metalloprotease
VKTLKQGLCLALLGASLSAVPALQTAAAGAPAADDSLVQQMRTEADGQVRISSERATGKVTFVRSTDGSDLMPSTGARSQGAAVDKASAYVDKYAAAFGAQRDQLVQGGVTNDRLGTTVSYTQEVDGIPVFGSALRVHLDKQGDLTAVNGELVPVKSVDTDAELSSDEAGERAVGLVEAQPPTDDEGRSDTAGIRAKSSELVLYKSGMVQGLPGGDTSLVYLVEVTNDANVRDMVFLDADTGKVVNRYSMIHDALDRKLYETSPDSEPVWEEGEDFPGALNEDQQNLVLSTGETYWLYQNVFGRDSYDGAGATMRTVNNDPRINCPNANWNGVTTNYCDGVTSDEVVAHEWTHAYTEYTHGLIYQWQSGALNEGYSDIFGETVDLVNGREDEGEGDISAKRTDDMCSSHSPALPLLTINAPAEIARDCLTGGASFGQPLDGTGITGDVALPVDAVEAGGTELDGCSPYTNQAEVAGKIVLVNRGFCPFTQKAQVATDMGAAALIIGNNDAGPIGMSGNLPDVVSTVSIGLADREAIRTQIGAGQTVNVTMKDAGGDREDSFRWLIGEKSDAFGGAIRDMWTPTCHGDPGKVSDVEYVCSTADSGGVHGNSGVVNHGYALLVDGGTYNGVTVTGIGLTKALPIYYRAMTVYQTPISNFVDHANALEGSCTELIGQTLKELSTDPNDSVDSTETITADDCEQVAAVIGAVQLRLDPTEQCAWTQLLEPGVEAGCGKGFTTPRRTSSPRTSRTGSTAGRRPTRASSAVRRSTGRPLRRTPRRSRRVTDTPARWRTARHPTRAPARSRRTTSAGPTTSPVVTSRCRPTRRRRGCRSTTTS